MISDANPSDAAGGPSPRGNHLPGAIIVGAEAVVADTTQTHVKAFNYAFAEEGLDWVWDQAVYNRLLCIPGTRERILHFWRESEPCRIDITGTGICDTINALHARKVAYYEAMVRAGDVKLRDGVLELFEEARAANLHIAILTSAAPISLAYPLRAAMGPDWNFTVQIMKGQWPGPGGTVSPLGHLNALARIKTPGHRCLAIEESATGVRAAMSAGIPVVVTPTLATAQQDFGGALRVLPSLAGVSLAMLQSWLAGGAPEPQEVRVEDDASLAEELTT